jgi:Polyketide cyclase / dehydrase and lipid transport
MYEFEFSADIDAPIAEVWAVWSDMAKYPQWDPRELELRLDGPFAAGTTGFSKQKGNPGGPFRIESVTVGTGWQNSSALPGGELLIGHSLAAVGTSRTHIVKTYRVTGPLVLLFRVWFAPALRRAQPRSFAALAARVASTQAPTA